MLSAQPPAIMPTYRVALITVSYGSGEALSAFLDTLREHEGTETTIVVVDNKPDADNVRELADCHGALYISLQNPGYGAGLNAGVAALRSQHPSETFDAFFFCNPDVRFIEPVVQGLAHRVLTASNGGSVGPKLLNTDGTVYPSARNIPSVGTGVGHAIFSKIWPGNPWTRRYQVADQNDVARVAGSLSGAAVMLPASVFTRLNGWDEAYFLHFEDIDLGWRIGKLGLVNIYEPQFSVEHSGAHSTKKQAVAVERAMTQSAIRFLSKRYQGWWNAPLRLVLTVGLRLRETLKLRTVHEHDGK